MGFLLQVGKTGTGKSYDSLVHAKETNSCVLYFCGVPSGRKWYEKKHPELINGFENYTEETVITKGGKYFIEDKSPFCLDGDEVLLDIVKKARQKIGDAPLMVVIDDGWWDVKVLPEKREPLFIELAKAETCFTIINLLRGENFGVPFETFFRARKLRAMERKIRRAIKKGNENETNQENY